MNKPKPKTGSRRKEPTRTADGRFAPKLTRKQKAWADEYLNDKKAPLSDIAKRTYNTTDTKTAYEISKQNLENTGIQIYLDEHVDKAKTRVVELIQSEREDIALRASQDILDRNTGKAINRTIHSTGVNINFINSVPRPEQDNTQDTITEAEIVE